MLKSIPAGARANQPKHVLTFPEALRLETVTLQAHHPLLADVLGRAATLLLHGNVFMEEDGTHAMVQSSTDPTQWYFINGSCPCKASTYRDEPCKHRTAVRLYQRVVQRLQDEAHHDLETHEPDVTYQGIAPQDVVLINHRPYVTYAGLLKRAHECGLVSLTASWIFNDNDVALARAMATFTDGRHFEECGDATPDNVGTRVRPAWRRMALTRAKARVLRDALGIEACTLEEGTDNV